MSTTIPPAEKRIQRKNVLGAFGRLLHATHGRQRLPEPHTVPEWCVPTDGNAVPRAWRSASGEARSHWAQMLRGLTRIRFTEAALNADEETVAFGMLEVSWEPRGENQGLGFGYVPYIRHVLNEGEDLPPLYWPFPEKLEVPTQQFLDGVANERTRSALAKLLAALRNLSPAICGWQYEARVEPRFVWSCGVAAAMTVRGAVRHIRGRRFHHPDERTRIDIVSEPEWHR